MPIFRNPFDPSRTLSCSCGHHQNQVEHDAALPAEQANLRVLEGAVMRALFPHDARRRSFLRAVGAGSAFAAISSIFPFSSLEAMAAEKGPLEKKSLKVGFVPITCATPLIMAGPMGFYAKQGLQVELTKTAGWALVRDKMLNKEYDASHMLSPMPLAISMGIGSVAQPMNVAAIQNTNGQAITLALKHKDKRDPKQWKGMVFAVPFEFSMHNFLLRYYVAEAGLDPDKDIQIRVTPPPEMVANLRAGNLDGYLGPDPFNQRAVYDEIGFIHVLSKEIWDGHPCCAFGVSDAFVKQNPNTFAALYRAILDASGYARDPAHRKEIAAAIAPANYLNQPVPVLEQVLTGRYADGLGNVKNEPSRIDFDPIPWHGLGVWIMSQMKRWGHLKGDVKYEDIANRVFMMTDARKRLAEMGIKEPTPKKIVVMGKEFDPKKADAYAKSFKITRA
jgi:nitrate/nitrite transport system substrate-binding protein